MAELKHELDENEIRKLECQFPAASGFAFRQAYEQAVSAGLSVVVSENGSIVEIRPDGTKKTIKTTPPPEVVEPGLKIYLR